MLTNIKEIIDHTALRKVLILDLFGNPILQDDITLNREVLLYKFRNLKVLDGAPIDY